jgi:uncharacterized membrane protein
MGEMDCMLGQGTEYALTARRNNSLTTSDRFFAFAFIASVSLGIAVAFAWIGAWLILPFAGVELLVLLWAFCSVERHARDYERLVIRGDLVQLELAEVAQVRRYQFNRWWAQVVYEHGGRRLALRSHGQEVEFGRHMTDEQRLAVAGALKQQLRSR